MTPTLLELVFAFFYIGLFSIGGGLVSLTFMQQVVVERGWITEEKFFNMVAISESTPGPIGVNMATYIGNEFYGVWGGILTTLAQVAPAMICIMIIATCVNKFQEKPIVKSMFAILRPTTSGIVLVAAVNVLVLTIINIPQNPSTLLTLEGIKGFFNVPSLIFYSLALVALFKTKIHPVVIVALGAVFGVIFL